MNKPTFKKLCLMYIQQLTNFPYIEKDFDALTDYGLLCKVVEYLNEIIKNNNIQNESITNLYNAFIELKEYVDNLDLQEEVNTKLDEMAEDGTLEQIIAKYIDTKLSIYADIESMENNSEIGEMFKLKGYDTTFITTSNPTISSLQINQNLYADVISKKVIIDSLGIDSSNIDTSLFAEIVEYVRNKGIEIVFDHKTYTLNGTITLTSANKLKMSGLGYDSVIDYTGNNYAFIFNTLQQAELKDFTINCVNNGGGIYCKYLTGEEQQNRLTSTNFRKVYIYNSKNPFKNDCHCGYVRFDECKFEVGTTDGIGLDFRGAYYPEFITIERCQIVNTYRDSNNTATAIYFNSGIMLNIMNNDIIGFYNGFYLDASSSDENIRTINLLHNSFWDILNKAVYTESNRGNLIKNISIKDSTITSSQRQDTLDYAFHIKDVRGLAIDSISITQVSNHQVFLSNCQVGYVKNIYYSHTVNQSNNQIGDNIDYEYTNNKKSLSIPANGSLDVEIGNTSNIFNFKNYLMTQRGANNSTSGLTLSNQSISNGKITFTLTNSSSSSMNINVYGF